MITSKHFSSIFRTASLFILVLAALALASPALAEQREPEPDICGMHGNVYFWSQAAAEDYIDNVVGSSDWVIGGHYLIGEQTLDNGYILQFWIHIIGYGILDKYEIEEYFFLPVCEGVLTYTQFDDLLVNKFVNPVLTEIENNRGTLLTAGETVVDTTDLPEIKEDDDNYPPDPIVPSNGDSPVETGDDEGEDDGGSVMVAGAADDIILTPLDPPFPQIP